MCFSFPSLLSKIKIKNNRLIAYGLPSLSSTTPLGRSPVDCIGVLEALKVDCRELIVIYKLSA